jgi:hypothetical protein
MRIYTYLLFIIQLFFCFSCKTSKDAFDPDKKYGSEKLKEDYTLFRNILEESHPGLYWYTSKDSMDYFFNNGFSQIKDSLTEPQFKNILSYIVAKINCGHTAVRYSKQYTAYLDTANLSLFPLGLKFWGDTMIVTVNINRKDSLLKRGTIITSINGLSQQQLRDTLFDYTVTDGYSLSGKYQSLSTGFNFGSWYRNIFGVPENIHVHYLDALGNDREAIIHPYNFKTDTSRKLADIIIPHYHPSKRERKAERLFASRNLQVDTVGKTAFMTVNSFAHGEHLKKFFRSSFKLLREKGIRNLVIDVRSNGGGDASNSTLLTRFLIDKKFKLADSLYAVTRSSQFNKYIGNSFLYRMMMTFVTRKELDNKYHFGYFERHYFTPRTKNHFNGEVYVLIGGNSFSATTLFAGAIKGQKNVTLVGEETGGAYYGNNAWMIPDVTLPNTGVRFRLPKFRMIVDRNRVKDGHGVLPDVYALPSAQAIKNGIDFKEEKVKELIDQRNSANK